MPSSGLLLTRFIGYLKDPNDRAKWIVAPEAAVVVKRIFQMSVVGHGPFQITRTLEREKVETLGYYLVKLGIGTRQNYNYTHPYRWSGTTVANMLEKQEYMGHTVNFRSYRES